MRVYTRNDTTYGAMKDESDDGHARGVQPETPIQTVVVDRGAVRKPRYLSMLKNLIRAVLDTVEEDRLE